MTSSENPKKKPWLAISIVVALSIVALNLGGYVLFRSRQTPEDPSKQTPVKIPTKAGIIPSETAEKAAPAERTTSARLAEEQRENGVRALREADYDRAITLFEAALALDEDVADVPVLLDLAKRLRGGEAKAEKIAKTETKPTPRPTPKRVKRASRARIIAARKRAAARKQAPAKVEDAVLLVTTVPEGLLIELDGRPTELSPARLSVKPGRHQVRLRRGPSVLFEETLSFSSGKTMSVKEDFSERLAKAEKPAPSSEKPEAKASVAADPNLDLVALLDRGRKAPKVTKAATVERTVPSTGVRPTSNTKPPGLLVYWPGRTGTEIRRTLGADLKGIDVKVVSGTSAFEEALRSTPTDAIMAAPYVLKKNGLSPALTAASSGSNRFLAVSMKTPVSRSELSKVTLGVVDELGKRQTPVFVARLLGVPKSPRLRRVGKLEDLLPLLQFSMAKAVLVRERDYKSLESRTRQKLHKVPLKAQAAPLAIAFVDGGRGSRVERALRGMRTSTKKALGVESWKR